MKITDLKETKESFILETQPDGSTLRVPKLVEINRSLELITGWRRFGHYLLDALFIFAFQFMVGVIIGVIGIDASFLNNVLLSRLLSVLTAFLYYAFTESVFHTSFGKMLTGSVVIDEYGENPSVATIIKRSLIRIIPFEALSCIGERGWHDVWSNTYVVSKSERNAIHSLLKNQSGGLSSQEDLLD